MKKPFLKKLLPLCLLLLFLLLLPLFVFKPSGVVNQGSDRDHQSSETSSSFSEALSSDVPEEEHALETDEPAFVRFRAKPVEPMKRGFNNLLLFPEMRIIERKYVEGKTFEGEDVIRPRGQVRSGGSELVKHSVEAELNLESLMEFINSDAQYLPLKIGKTEVAYVSVERLTDRGEHTITLTGKLKGEKEASDVIIVFHDGVVNGTFEFYSQRRLVEYGTSASGAVSIMEMDLDKVDEQMTCALCDGCSEFSSHSKALSESPMHLSEHTHIEPVLGEDVLADNFPSGSYVSDAVITYTEGAKNAKGGAANIEARILNGIAGVNTLLSNSKMDDMFISLVAVAQEIDTEDRRDYLWIDAGRELTYGAELRTSLGADFHAILYSGGGGIAGYIPELYTPYGHGPHNPFFVVGANSVGGASSSFSHEWGHIAGGVHSWNDGGSDWVEYRHGWRFKGTDGKNYRTVMSYNNDYGVSYPRIGYLSNPNETFQGVPLGAVTGYNGLLVDLNNNGQIDEGDEVDPFMDPDQIYGGGGREANGGDGYNGRRPELGANNALAVETYKTWIPDANTRSAMAIVSPTAGAIYSMGSTIPVGWTVNDHFTEITVNLLKAGVYVETLGTYLGHYTTHEYPITTNYEPGDDYTVELSLSTGETLTSNVFSIDPFHSDHVDQTLISFAGKDFFIDLPDLAAFTYTIIDPPSEGSITGTAPNYIYIPNTSGSYTDSFTYQVSFMGGDSKEVTLSIKSANLLASFSFEEGTGTQAADSTGRGNDATLVGATWTDDGLIGKGLEMDGVDDYLELALGDFANSQEEVTLSFWLKLTDNDYYSIEGTLLRALNSTGETVYNIDAPYNAFYVYWALGTGAILNETFRDNEFYNGQAWQHWVFTKNTHTNTTSFYMNGVLEGEVTNDTSPLDAIASVRIGLGDDPDQSYLGSIDEIQFYDTALGVEEIALMNYETRLQVGLLAHWKMDEADGDIIYDSSGGDHHATLDSGTRLQSAVKGGGLEFNGTSDYVLLPGSAFAEISDEVTIAFWAYGISQPRQDLIFRADNASGTGRLKIALPWSDGDIFWEGGNTRFTVSATPAVYNEVWSHWAFTQNSSTGSMSIYHNGVLFGTSTENTLNFSDITTAYFGSSTQQNYYKGRADDVRLYNVELKALAVQELYESYSGGYGEWIASYNNDTYSSGVLDLDQDGVPNLIEYVANRNPIIQESGGSNQVIQLTSTNSTFKINRKEGSAEDTLQIFQYSTDMVNWTDIDLSDDSSPFVIIDAPENGEESITVTLDPTYISNNGNRCFVRLKVEEK